MTKRLSILLVLLAGAVAAMSTVAFAAASPPANSSLPTVGGSAREGQTLTATSGSWAGAAPIAYAYRWQRCNSTGGSCNSIGNATDQNYVVSHGDVGNKIRVRVTASNADGVTQATSDATGAVLAAGNEPANTKQPNPSGTPQEGQTVTSDTGNWSGIKPITFSYQWQSCTAVNPVCTNLTGSTASSYLVGSGQIGTLLRVNVTATNSAGKTSAFSNLTSAVLAKAGAPANATLPVVSGSRTVGQRLQTTTGTWSGVSNTGFGYQWLRCNSSGSGCSGIAGATGTSYGVGHADLGHGIRVNVTATNASGSTTALSATAVIAAVRIYKFTAILRPGQEVGYAVKASSSAAGHFTAKLSGTSFSWTLSFSHLTGRPTHASLNKGLRHANGAAFKSLCRYCTSPAHGKTTLTASQRDALLRGRAYANVFTARNTHGEIRGQIVRVS